MIDTTEINPTFDDTTTKEIASALSTAERTVKTAQDLHDALAAAKRRNEAGKDASEIEKELTTAKLQVSNITQQIQTITRVFPDQAPDKLIQSGMIDYEGYIETRKQHPPIPTGFKVLNDMLNGGLDPETLVIILGAPGGGKTTLTNQIAVHAADGGRPVLYVTSEDTPFRLYSKTLARQGQMNYKDVLRGKDEYKEKIKETLKLYKESNAAQLLYYLDATSGCEMATIREKATEVFNKHKDCGEGILVIDYLQRLARSQQTYKSGNGDVRMAVTMITEEIRSIASELKCTVIALAAQSRQSGYGTANSLTSAKESGDVEYTADVLITIGEDDNRPPVTPHLKSRVLHIAKNRQGEEGLISFDFYGARQQFTECTIQSISQSELAPNIRKKGK